MNIAETLFATEVAEVTEKFKGRGLCDLSVLCG